MRDIINNIRIRKALCIIMLLILFIPVFAEDANTYWFLHLDDGTGHTRSCTFYKTYEQFDHNFYKFISRNTMWREEELHELYNKSVFHVCSCNNDFMFNDINDIMVANNFTYCATFGTRCCCNKNIILEVIIYRYFGNIMYRMVIDSPTF